MLTPEQIEARKGKLTGSRVAALMSGDPRRILNLYYEMTDDPRYDASSYTYKGEDDWAMRLGTVTEPLHLDWLGEQWGSPILRRGEVAVSSRQGWDFMACTLDGWSTKHNIAVEAKHNNGFEPWDGLIQRHMPQLHQTMFVTDVAEVWLSVIRGAAKPEAILIKWDKVYGGELLRRAQDFMDSVGMGIPPVALPAASGPTIVPADQRRPYDLSASNEWGDAAGTWLQNKGAAEAFAASLDTLKALIPDDASQVKGGGIIAKVAKNGRITIKEEKTNAGKTA